MQACRGCPAPSMIVATVSNGELVSHNAAFAVTHPGSRAGELVVDNTNAWKPKALVQSTEWAGQLHCVEYSTQGVGLHDTDATAAAGQLL